MRACFSWHLLFLALSRNQPPLPSLRARPHGVKTYFRTTGGEWKPPSATAIRQLEVLATRTARQPHFPRCSRPSPLTPSRPTLGNMSCVYLLFPRKSLAVSVMFTSIWASPESGAVLSAYTSPFRLFLAVSPLPLRRSHPIIFRQLMSTIPQGASGLTAHTGFRPGPQRIPAEQSTSDEIKRLIVRFC